MNDSDFRYLFSRENLVLTFGKEEGERLFQQVKEMNEGKTLRRGGSTKPFKEWLLTQCETDEAWKKTKFCTPDAMAYARNMPSDSEPKAPAEQEQVEDIPRESIPDPESEEKSDPEPRPIKEPLQIKVKKTDQCDAQMLMGSLRPAYKHRDSQEFQGALNLFTQCEGWTFPEKKINPKLVEARKKYKGEIDSCKTDANYSDKSDAEKKVILARCKAQYYTKVANGEL